MSSDGLTGKMGILSMTIISLRLTRTDNVHITLPKGQWHVKKLLEGEVLADVADGKLSIHIPPHGADTIVLERRAPTDTATGRE